MNQCTTSRAHFFLTQWQGLCWDPSRNCVRAERFVECRGSKPAKHEIRIGNAFEGSALRRASSATISSAAAEWSPVFQGLRVTTQDADCWMSVLVGLGMGSRGLKARDLTARAPLRPSCTYFRSPSGACSHCLLLRRSATAVAKTRRKLSNIRLSITR